MLERLERPLPASWSHQRDAEVITISRGISIARLAAEIGASRSHAKRAVVHLEEQGLVIRRRADGELKMKPSACASRRSLYQHAHSRPERLRHAWSGRREGSWRTLNDGSACRRDGVINS